MSELALRPIDLDGDRDVLIRFVRDVFVVSFGDDQTFVREFGEDGAGYVAWLRKGISDDPSVAALAVLEDAPVGLVVTGRFRDDPAVGYVFHYYLAPQARGLGLGAALDDYAMAVLARRGHGLARLSVAEANTPAMRFYARRGWRPVGPRLDQPGVIYLEKATT